MAASTDKLSGSRQHQIQQVYNLILQRLCGSSNASIGPQNVGAAPPTMSCQEAQAYANDFVTYANNHPNNPISQLYLAWFLNQSNLPQNLGSDIITAAKTTAGVAGATAQDLVSGGCQPPHGAINPVAYWEYFTCVLTNKNTWIRVGEGVVALILLDVGLKAFTNRSIIETVAKKTPAGKAAKVFS